MDNVGSKEFKSCLLLILGFFLGFLIFIHHEEFLNLSTQLQLPSLIALVLLQIPFIGLGGWPFKTLVTPLGYSLRWRDWFGLSFVANFINQILPYRPGLAFRYFYLKKNYGMTLSHFTVTMLLYTWIMLLCSSMMIIAPWLLRASLQRENIMVFTLWGTFGLLGLMVVFVLGLLWIKHHKPHWIRQKQVFAHLKSLVKNPKILMMTVAGFILMQGCLILSFKLVFMALNHSVHWLDLVFIAGLFIWCLIVPITPGNIGLIEAFMGGLTQTLYGQFSLGFSAIVLWRIAQLGVGLLLGTGFSWLLIGQILPQKHVLKSAINK